MQPRKISFHLQHVARPEHLERILGVISKEPHDNVADIHLRLSQSGYSVTYDGVRRSLDVGAKLSLVEKKGASLYLLTDRGRALQSLALYRREVYCDVIHFFLFATWELEGNQSYWSWSYSKICELFWDNRPEIESRRIMFGQISDLAEKTFPEIDAVLGEETIGAVSNWLKQLEPTFLIIEDNKLIASKEREWFSPELALLSISYLYALKKAVIATPILLDKNSLQILTSLCLASQETIISMIDIASKTYAFIEIHTGEWGSSAILKQELNISMFT
jgi:hypothetical protein